jgi:hypothetical protein
MIREMDRAYPKRPDRGVPRGVPVASSVVCAVPEMLDFGRAGFLVENVSVEGWARPNLTDGFDNDRF